MGKSFDYRKKMNNNRKIHIKRVRKIVLSSAVASTLVFQPFIPVIENGKLVGFTEESASAATLAEVGILEDIDIDAALGNLEGPGPYELDLDLTGTGLANIDLVSPQTVALFNLPSLAGNIATAGPADVRVELLPVTLDDLPALGTLVSNLTGTLDTAVSGIVGTLDTIVELLPADVLEVNGLEELQNAVAALNNVDAALADLLVYEDQVGAVINPDGSISVDFTSGLDKYLDTAVDRVVTELLNDVIVAAQGLEVNLLQEVPIVDTVVNGLINGILSTVTGTILPTVQTAVDGIASGTTNLTGELAAAQVIGSTQVNLPTTINRVPEVSGEVPISGAVINTNFIDLTLLSTLPLETSVVLPELDTTAPIITPIADVTTNEDAPIAPILVESNEEGSIVVNELPSGLTFDEASGLITGTPVVDDWGQTEEERDFTVEVTATDDAGNKATPETFVITVQRDTDGDGDPDVTDPDDDNDGVPDEEEVENGTDPKVDDIAPVITPIDDVTGLEDSVIENILVEVNEASDVTVNGLPEGIVFDETTNSITGTLTVEDWGASEETRVSNVTVTATDETGNESTETFTITVERDTDGDGDPDVMDPDDDNDGVPDDEEIENGTDPKVDELAPVISPIEDATATEDEPIEAILIEVDESNEFTVDVAGLPEGLEYDPESESIVGTPTIEEWEGTEETREFETTVTATDEAGNTDTEEFVITIERDTDGDGDPDVTDPDDDNDGVPDDEEIENGTDPKVDEFAPVISQIEDTVAIENDPIEDIIVEVDESSDITTEGLPDGLEYDSETESITGTPTVPDWGELEETRDFETSVTATDEAGNTDTEEFVITVERDTDGDGDPDVTDPDDDNDGVTDEEEISNGTDPKDDTDTPDLEAPNAPEVDGVTSEDTEIVGSTEPGAEVTVTFPNGETATGTADEEGNFVVVIPEDIDLTGGEQLEVVAEDEAGNVSEVTPIEVDDTTAPIILEIEDQTVIEGNPIEDIEVIVENPGEQAALARVMAINLIMPLATPLVDGAIVTGLPDGVTFDTNGNIISGVPIVDDWGATEESRDFVVTVTARDEAGNEATDEFTITVLRDTDGDENPDVTDPDDDNDGITDEEEIEAGTDPKNPDVLAPIILPIENVDVVENQPIDDIVVDVNEPSDVIVDGLPNGLEYDPETGIISGTPVVNDWGDNETERDYVVTITAEDEAGNTSTLEFILVVQRDTDEDGDPNVTDPDDDNDGATDEVEIQAGTNPWDNTNYPRSGSGSANNTVKNQAMLPQTGESQSIFAVVSGLVLAAVSSAMLMFNKKKNSSNSSKRNIKK
ncbi:putative Ig domain-containing protein [Carnobacterium sp.]|uniref:putative Ig domain-containing protein n=1 Tax=Carnobacterium sp. TaxID=48221 RepID=UPI00388D6698